MLDWGIGDRATKKDPKGLYCLNSLTTHMADLTPHYYLWRGQCYSLEKKIVSLLLKGVLIFVISFFSEFVYAENKAPL